MASVHCTLHANFTDDCTVLQFAARGGFGGLSDGARATHEAAVTSQVVHLQRLYMEYLQGARQVQLNGTEAALAARHRTYSSSSVGSLPAAGALYRSSTGVAAHPNGNNGTGTGAATGMNSTVRSVHSSNQALYQMTGLSGAVSGTPADQESVDESSMAAKGLNMAFSIVSELLK
jgi:hypothetical protein